MPRYCPNCSFDLSSVMIKNTPTHTAQEEETDAPVQQEESEVITTKQAKKKAIDEGNVKVVKVRGATKKQAEHLAKAREKARQKALEAKEKKQDLKPLFLF